MNSPYTLTEFSPRTFEEVECSNEILLCSEITIPYPKPDIDQIIQLKQKVEIESITQIPVKTLNCKSKSQNLLIRGFLFLTVEYSSDLPEQTVHVVHSRIPFDALVEDKGCTSHKLSLQVKIDPIWTEKIHSRLLENATSLFLWFKKENPCNLQGNDGYDCSHSLSSCSFTSKQIAINQTLILPPHQPKISSILDQICSVEIKRAEVRLTPLSTHCCNKPNRKVVIKGNAEVLIKYESASERQDVHASTFELPICVLVDWVGGPPPYSPICIEVIVEHFQIDHLDANQLFCVLLLRLNISRQH